MKRRVVVTGMGVRTALGDSPDDLWGALTAGRSAIRRIGRFDPSGFPTQIAGEIEGYPGPPPGLIQTLAHEAADNAVRDAGDLGLGEPDRAAVSLACGLGSYEHPEFLGAAAGAAVEGGGMDAAAFGARLRETLRERALERMSPGLQAASIAARFGFAGEMLAVDTACAAGAQALGSALRWIRSGRADVVLAGGADSQIYPLGLASFCLLKALSRRNDEPQRASRPFDADRDGFVLGEGAAMLVLEEYEHARRRGARVYAELRGFGDACDAFRATDPHPQGRGAVLAMSRALADAGAAPGQIGYVNAHGTSTLANDRVESRALRTLFGAHAEHLAISSTKSALGHLTEAAGAVEAVITVLALGRGVAPPTLNLEHADPECDLDYTPLRPRQFAGDLALSNSFGFGGQCACLVFARL